MIRLEAKPSVLFVIDGLDFGGGERVFLQLCRGLKDRMHIYVASSPGGTFEKKIMAEGIRFYPLDMIQRLSFRAIGRLKQIIRNDKIQIVHSQGARSDFFARVA